jgi:hypothetical protein
MEKLGISTRYQGYALVGVMKMPKHYVTPKMQDDLKRIWDKYREENDIADSIMLVLVNADLFLYQTPENIVEFIEAEVKRQREFREKERDKK